MFINQINIMKLKANKRLWISIDSNRYSTDLKIYLNHFQY